MGSLSQQLFLLNAKNTDTSNTEITGKLDCQTSHLFKGLINAKITCHTFHHNILLMWGK